MAAQDQSILTRSYKTSIIKDNADCKCSEYVTNMMWQCITYLVVVWYVSLNKKTGKAELANTYTGISANITMHHTKNWYERKPQPVVKTVKPLSYGTLQFALMEKHYLFKSIAAFVRVNYIFTITINCFLSTYYFSIHNYLQLIS